MNFLPLKFYIISSFINFGTSFILAFVLLKNFRTKANRLFSLFSFSVAFWSLLYSIWLLSGQTDIAEFYLRTCMVGVLFMPSLFIHFVTVFLNKPKSVKFYIFNYTLSVLFTLTIYTPLYAKNPEKHLVFPYWLHPGPVFHFALAQFIIMVIYSFILMYKELKTAKGIFRNQLLYVFIGTAIGYAGGVTNYFCWYRLPIPPFLNACVAFYVGFVTYAIARYKLLDIHFVIRRSITNIILIAILSVTIILTVSIKFKIISAVILSSLVVVFLPKLKTRTENTVNHIFYKEKYKYQDKLEEFREDILAIHKEEDIFSRTAKTLSETLGVREIGIFTIDNVSGDYVLRTGIGLEKQEELRIPGNTGITVWLKKNKKVFVKEEMEKVLEHTELGLIRETLSNLEATVCVPVLFENELVGIITLGEKSSGDMYSHIDTEILHHIGTQLAFALNYRRKEEELRREKELASIGIMTAEISHQLRNLLVSPRTFIDLAPQRRNDDEFFGDFRKLAETQIAKLDEKLEYISLFGRSVNLKYASININQVLENILTEYSDMLKNITVVKEFSGLPLVRCDGEQVKLIFGNIMINSIEAMQDKPGGKIRVRTRINENPASEMKSLAERWIRIEIKDDGPGMNEEMYKKLFTPFVTTKSVGGIKEKGAGLGLPIAKKIVDLHKGAIDIRSSEGKGTTAIIDLPVQMKEEPKPPAEEMDAGMPPWLKELKKRLNEEKLLDERSNEK